MTRMTHRMLAASAATAALATACGGAVEPIDLTPIADYAAPDYTVEDERELEVDTFTRTADDGAKESVTCTPTGPTPISKTFREFPAFGVTGPLLPGLIVEGSGFEEGDMRVIPLARAPLTLVSSLASETPNVEIEAPTSSSINAAVAQLKRDADARLTGIDVVPGDITYRASETYSFEASAMEAGVSLRYTSAFVEAGMDTAYEQERGVERHTILVRLVQPMYTISMERDAIADPADHFADTVRQDDVDTMVGNGAMSAENPPLVIDSVTYGRVMYFSMSSTTATSSQELSLAIDAATRKYEGEADLSTRQQQLLSTSEISMLAYGGDQDLALGAIRSANLADFFGSANATTAAPLSFLLRTLDGALVEVTDTANVSNLLCESEQADYAFGVKLSDIHGRVRVYVNGKKVLDEKHTPENIVKPGKQYKKGSGSASINQYLNVGNQAANNTIEVQYDNVTCVDAQFTVEFTVDGAKELTRSLKPKCAFSFDWHFTANTANGTVTFVE